MIDFKHLRMAPDVQRILSEFVVLDGFLSIDFSKIAVSDQLISFNFISSAATCEFDFFRIEEWTQDMHMLFASCLLFLELFGNFLLRQTQKSRDTRNLQEYGGLAKLSGVRWFKFNQLSTVMKGIHSNWTLHFPDIQWCNVHSACSTCA